jgi:hypothetical protein
MRQEGGFVACFPQNVSMVHSPKVAAITGDHCQADIGFSVVPPSCLA